jgi:protein-S-isoprenylcysteine O-methyltransferase Ste14
LALDDVAWAPLYVPSDRYGNSGDLEWSPRRDQLILGAEMAFAASGKTAAIGEGPFRLFAAVLVGAGLAISGYYRARSARARGPLGPGGRGVVLVALRLVGGAALLPPAAYLVHPPWVSWARVPLPPELRWLAGLAGIGLLALLVWILRSLGLNLGPSHETRQGHTLVTSGPYSFVRHPLYATGALLSVALGLLAGLWWPLVWLVPGLLLLGWRTPKEEARLVEVFGGGYRDYMRRTGRYLPRIGRR